MASTTTKAATVDRETTKGEAAQTASNLHGSHGGDTSTCTPKGNSGAARRHKRGNGLQKETAVLSTNYSGGGAGATVATIFYIIVTFIGILCSALFSQAKASSR